MPSGTKAEEQYDAVVIGSGFGGSISALRLAEAGKSVLVLERGKRYVPGEFPRDVRDTDRLFWRYATRPQARGLYDMRFHSGIATLCASGVGGGSLVYANIHIRPDAELFDDPRWPKGMTRATLDPYYDRVARTLGVAPVPADIPLPKRDRYRRMAEEAGWPVFDPDQAVTWKDPEHATPGRTACRLCAQCEFGCQHGAKNTLDFTYLAEAERLGAQVRTNTLARYISPTRKGYHVHFVDVETGQAGTVTGKRVVLSAGTQGTNEILFRSRESAGTLPNVSPRLGHGFSGNGDFLGSIQNSREPFEPWKGPDVTSVIKFEDAPRFTMAAPTFNREVMRVLASQGQPPVERFRFVGSLLYPFMNGIMPWIFRSGMLNRPAPIHQPHAGDPARMTMLFAIGRDNAGGRVAWKRDRIDIQWDFEGENQELVRKMGAAMEESARRYGGTFAPLVTWGLFRRIFTVHPLGGCHLSETPETGVVSQHGEVHGYPGLFVADGSVIPTSIGFHPVMTISAVSERIADAAAASFAS